METKPVLIITPPNRGGKRGGVPEPNSNIGYQAVNLHGAAVAWLKRRKRAGSGGSSSKADHVAGQGSRAGQQR